MTAETEKDTDRLTPHNLAQFTGTEHYYKHWTGMIQYTDGVKYVEESGGGWIIDLIASYQGEKINGIITIKRSFQVWNIKRDQGGFIATMQEDSDQPVLVEQKGEYTDLPMDIEMWLESGVLILPSEH